jgi:PadR family transcriptional regulator, regulatory protein AphA
MNRPEAYPITYGVLGMLAFWGPMSGYDIKRLFDTMLSPMWGAAHSQIYKELRRMRELGWVEMERIEQETRPDRKVYQITETGREALSQWQEQRADVFQLRDEMLLKILFGSFATPEALASNLRASIADHEMHLLAYRQNSLYVARCGESPFPEQRRNPYVTESEGDPFFALLNHFAIDFEQTYIRWLYEVLTFTEQWKQQQEVEQKHTSDINQ